MAFLPNNITKEHVLKAIEKIEFENRKLFKPTRWQVIINNKSYPPKEVMKYAHEQMNGEALWNYGGGEGTNRYLKKFGFEMIDMQEDSIQKLIENYKTHIKETHLNDEKYKWQLLSQFKERPNLEAANLFEEIKSINYSNLIFKHGKAVLYHLLSAKPEEMRLLFKSLFNEEKPLTDRIKLFNSETLILYRSIGQNLQHHQDERTIGTYLTFHNPDKYTFYKYSFYKKMCELLSEKEAKKNEKYEHYLILVNRIIEEYIQDDAVLIDLVKSYIPDFYDGINHLLLTQDILYQMLDKKESVNYWLYAPGENAHKWDEFYEEGIMGLGWDELGDLDDYANKSEIKKKLQEIENVESTKQNDTAANYEFHKVIKEGDIIIVKKGISELLGYGEVTSEYYYDENRDTYQKCRKVDWKLKGNWKVDFNLPVKTLTDVTKYPTDDKNFAKYSERLIAIMERNINDSSKNDAMNYKPELNQILYGPPGTGKTYHTILEAAKIITGNETIGFEEALKVFNTNLHNQIEFITFHQNYSYEDFIQGLRPDTENGNALTFDKKDGVFKRIADKALKNLTASNNPASVKKEFMDVFNELIQPLNNEEVNEIEIRMKKSSYFITEVGEKSIAFRKNIGDSEHTLSINTLHKMYDKGENDFILGGLQPYYNPLLQLLLDKGKSTVTAVTKKNYVIIIDEINRANISRVFGELITLIEEDKRSHGKIPMTVTLPSGDPFTVPSNLYIIGTMNTADKSIALLDIALRRRFEFVPMYPKYSGLEKPVHDDAILFKINEAIIKRKGHDFTIGHSYFMGENYSLENTINHKVIPLLLEYFMNDEKEVTNLLKDAGITIGEWPLKMIS
jgi:5-methylcytosine-specific restriction protein B